MGLSQVDNIYVCTFIFDFFFIGQFSKSRKQITYLLLTSSNELKP